MARQVSEDDEISRIKKQNKNAPTQASPAATPETAEERQPATPAPVHAPIIREVPERDTEEHTRRNPIAR